MSDGCGRRTFLQNLLASVGSASLIGTVKPREIPALASLEAEEALEYDPRPQPPLGVTPLMRAVTASYARVRWNPLRLESNCGFRYVARGRRTGSVRLYFEAPGQRRVNTASPADGDSCKILYFVDHGSLDFVEVAAVDTCAIGEQCEVDFDLLCMKIGLPISTLTH